MRKRVTDKQIKSFFWQAGELPFDNKASYLLGDLANYGVSRCKKMYSGWRGVIYQFDIYTNKDFLVSLLVELSTDFTLKEVEQAILRLYQNGGLIASNDPETFKKWEREISPAYPYSHAKYSATRFLEALRIKLYS